MTMPISENQPDLLSGAGGNGKTKAAAKPKKDAKPPGTAVAVDDPKKRQQVARTPEPAPSTFLAVVMKAATDPACDPAKMHSLLDFQERLKSAEAKEAFDDALVALQAELPSIKRDRTIEVRAKDQRTGERTGKLLQKTPYATFEAIHDAVRPLLTKYGFAISFSTEPMADGRIIVRTTLMRKGHSISTAFPLPAETSGSKNNVQGWGSAQSYGKRYGIIALLSIVSHAPEDADTDGNEGRFVRSKDGLSEEVEVETLSDEQVADLNARMMKCKVPLQKVLSHYGIKSLADLPAKMLETALKACDDYAANQKRVEAESFPGDQARRTK